MGWECSVYEHLHIVPQLPWISSTPLISLLASEVCYESWCRANVRITGANRALGVAEVYLDEDTLCTVFGGEIVVRLIYQFTWRACRARKEDDGTSIPG